MYALSAFEELRITDIPKNVIIKKDIIRQQSVHLQGTMLDLFKSLKTAFTVQEKESSFMLSKVINPTLKWGANNMNSCKEYSQMTFRGIGFCVL